MNLTKFTPEAYEHLNSAVFIKNLKGKYLWANSFFIQISSGARSLGEVQNKEDYDFPWHPYADELRANDQLLFRKCESLSSFERIIRHDGTKINIFSRKELLFENNRLIGLLGLSFVLPDIKQNSLFTHREHEILSLVAKGYTDKEIAKKLNLSPRTVETHINNAKQKSAVRTRSELTARFMLQYP